MRDCATVWFLGLDGHYVLVGMDPDIPEFAASVGGQMKPLLHYFAFNARLDAISSVAASVAVCPQIKE